MTPLGPERYNGVRGDMGILAQWGGAMLMQQLLPALYDDTSLHEQRRWRDRLHSTEPFLVDLARHGTRDSEWQSRIIDPASIVIPTLCVGGLRDVYAQTMIDIYEHVQGPKKLLLGPWTHTFPQDAPFEPVDFLSICLRWWEKWLRGKDDGLMSEPPVTVFVQGSSPGWRAFESWPAPDVVDVVLGSDTGERLLPSTGQVNPSAGIIGEYQPDPTIGALSAFGGELGGVGSALDPHEDDIKSMSFTSDPLSHDIHILGQSYVSITLAPSAPNGVGNAVRLVVRLAAVDPSGRWRVISTGVLSPERPATVHDVPLTPISGVIAAGNRLRVTVTDSDFPRLTPLPSPTPLQATNIRLVLPTVTKDSGHAVDLTKPEEPPTGFLAARPDAAGFEDRWEITRDIINDGIEVAIGASSPPGRPGRGHRFEARSDVHAKVRRRAPDGALTRGIHTATLRMTTGERIRVQTTVRCTQTAMWARGEVEVDGLPIYSKTWEEPLGDARAQSHDPLDNAIPTIERS